MRDGRLLHPSVTAECLRRVTSYTTLRPSATQAFYCIYLPSEGSGEGSRAPLRSGAAAAAGTANISNPWFYVTNDTSLSAVAWP